MNLWRGLRNLPREVWILFTATFVNRAGTMVLPFMVLYLTRSLAISPGRAALALTAYGVGALVTAPLSGRLSDRVGALGVIKSSLFFSGGLLLLFPLARRFVSVLVLSFLWAILNEAVRPASLAVVADLVPAHQRKAAFALSRLAVNLGMSIGPAIGGFLAARSFHALFLVDGATSILAGVVLALAPWQAPRQIRTHEPPWPEPEDLGREIEAEGVTPPSPSTPARHLSASLNPNLLYFLAAMIPVQLVFFQLSSSFPLFLVRHLALPESVYGLVFTINTLLIVLVEVPLNTLMAHWTHRRALVLGALLYAIGFGSLAFVTRPVGVAATVVVWTFGEMILLPSSAAYVAEIAPQENRGEYMGLYTMSFSMAFAVGPWIGAEILDRLGAQTLWSAAFICGCVSAFMMSRIRSSVAVRARD